MFKLYLRYQSSEPLIPGMPEEIKANYNSLEEAEAQAVHDLTVSGRAAETGYSPVRIEDESGSIVRDRGDLEKAAAKA